MRKTFLYLLTAFISATTLVSCLGDSESTYEGSSEFSVIKLSEATNQKYAITAAGLFVTWDGIKDYSVGDAMVLSYKINFSNISGSILNADYAAPVSDDYVFRNARQKQVKMENADTIPANNPRGFKSFNLLFNPTSEFLDRWKFEYTASVVEGEYMDIDFYFDSREGMQVDSKGEPLPAGTYIIDVKFNVSGTPNTGAEATTKKGSAVAQFAELRQKFRPLQIDETNGTKVSIWLRYYKDGETTRPNYMQNAGNLLY